VTNSLTGAANNYLMYDAYKQGLNPQLSGYNKAGGTVDSGVQKGF
jgi:hypothetical protein